MDSDVKARGEGRVFRKSICCAVAAVTALCTTAQAAIQVTAGGAGPLTFDSAPAASEWSTFSISGSGNTFLDAAGLDPAVQAIAASQITTALPTDTANPPGNNGNARYNSTLDVIQTAATGNAATLLMATLQNMSGRTLDAISISYDLNVYAPAAGDLPGHRVFYSFTGDANSWVLIPELSDFETPTTGFGATVNLTWPDNTTLYLLWADDNADGHTDPKYTIDNFVIAFPGEPPTITDPPADQTVVQCRPVTFSVSAIGAAPITYQWFKDNGEILGANSPDYTIASPQAADAGEYHVVVSNGAGSVPSASATLTVNADTQVPQVLYAIGSPDGSTLTLTFDEPVAADVAAQTFNYEMYVVGNTSAPTLMSSAIIQDETNLVLTSEFPRVTGQNYFLRVLGRKDACAANEAFTPVDVHLVQMIELLAVDGLTTTWLYNEQNIDLGGTGWQNLSYDDTTWLSGVSVLTQTGGEGNPPPNWVIGGAILTPQNAGGPETTYFRSRFNLPTTPGAVTVQFTHWIDDGAVFHINGTEVGRVRMPEGAYSHATDGGSPAEPHPEEGPIVVPSSALFGGDNVMAVDVHQSGTGSSDITMGVRMVAYVTNFSSGLSIAAEPQDQTVNEGQPASLTVVAEGAVPFTYQWRKDGVPVDGATGPVLSFTAALPSDTGDYDVIITNPAGTTNSEVATLTVVADTTAPTILSVLGNVDLTTFRVTFSEPMDELSASETLSYFINLVGGGGDLAITSATLTDGTNLVLVTQDPRVQGLDYELQVFGVHDQSVAQNEVSPSTYRIASGIAVIMPDDITLWQYDQLAVDHTGDGWNTAGFDASTWPVGFAGLSSATPEIVPAGYELRTTTLVPQNQGGPKTIYFRVPFDFPGSLSGAHLEAVGVIDDGAVFYVNGTEAGRIRIDDDPVIFTSDADTAPETGETHPAENVPLSTTGVTGTGNLLAVELHQSGTGSSDAILSIQLVAYVTEFGSLPTGPELEVSHNATTGEVTITWTGGGTLQSTTQVGPGAAWTAIPGAASPFTFTPSGDQGFFRVVQ